MSYVRSTSQRRSPQRGDSKEGSRAREPEPPSVAVIAALQRSAGNHATAAYLRSTAPRLHRAVRRHDTSTELPQTDKQFTATLEGTQQGQLSLACSPSDTVAQLISFAESEFPQANISRVLRGGQILAAATPLDAGAYKLVTVAKSALPVPYRLFVDPALKGADPAAYARTEYLTNWNRAKRIVGDLRKLKQGTGSTGEGETKKLTASSGPGLPSPDNWDVSPTLDKAVFRGYGIVIHFEHKTLMHDNSHKVGYKSTIKPLGDGTFELKANANYAPTTTQREEKGADAFIKMNLNQVWAAQIAYYQQIAEKLGKQDRIVQGIVRSLIQNASTLSTYWISPSFNAVGEIEITDQDDLLALAGSPNGNAALYLLLQNPELAGSPVIPDLTDDGALLASLLSIKMVNTEKTPDMHVTIKRPNL